MNFKLHPLIATTLLVSVIGCANTTLARISVDEDVPETRVQGAGLIGVLPLELSSLSMDATSTEDYASEEFDYVTEIKFKSLSFDITASSTDSSTDSFEDGIEDNFDFINSMELFIKATFDGEEQQTRIAYLDAEDAQVGSGSNHLKLTLDNVDILDYVEADEGYEVVVNANGNVPPDDVIFDGKAVYRVGIGFD